MSGVHAAIIALTIVVIVLQAKTLIMLGKQMPPLPKMLRRGLPTGCAGSPPSYCAKKGDIRCEAMCCGEFCKNPLDERCLKYCTPSLEETCQQYCKPMPASS